MTAPPSSEGEKDRECIHGIPQRARIRATEHFAKCRNGLPTSSGLLEGERKNLLEAVANGAKSAGIFKKLGEVEAELAKIQNRIEAIKSEIAGLESQQLNKEDLRQALAEFTPVWDQLTTAERSRMLRLLVEEVRFHAGESEVEILFRPDGIKALGQKEESA